MHKEKSLFKNVVSFWTRSLFCCSDEKSGIIYASLTADLHMTLKCQAHIKKTQLIKQYDPGRLTKLTVFEWTYANSLKEREKTAESQSANERLYFKTSEHFPFVRLFLNQI